MLQFSVRPTSLPAMPGGYLIESFSVSQVSTRNFSICMTPVKCGTGIPLIEVDGSTVESQTSSSATYKINGVESRVKVERTQSATPPTTGTFDVTYKGKSVKGRYMNSLLLLFIYFLLLFYFIFIIDQLEFLLNITVGFTLLFLIAGFHVISSLVRNFYQLNCKFSIEFALLDSTWWSVFDHHLGPDNEIHGLLSAD